MLTLAELDYFERARVVEKEDNLGLALGAEIIRDRVYLFVSIFSTLPSPSWRFAITDRIPCIQRVSIRRTPLGNQPPPNPQRCRRQESRDLYPSAYISE